ncbi:MAG: hypothetical protein IJT23_04965 [Clostridia bacterium]|nr:hypothetical protein [Clostridia bacterium]
MYGYTIFHEDILNSLIKSVRSNLASQTYIFEGDAGLNLLDAAKLFAMALTCENTDTAPCNTCHVCHESSVGTNPDIIMVEKPSDRKSIGVDPIRDLTADVIIKPFHGLRKVYIIREGDLLTAEAQNALLKTLEEPPSYAVFIIITTNRNLMLQTVLSRATVVFFPPVKDGVIRNYLDEHYPEAQNKEMLVKLAGGIPKEIDNMMEDEQFYVTRREAAGKLPLLLTKNKLYAFDIQKYLVDNKDDVQKILNMWILMLRDVLIISLGEADRAINTDLSSELVPLAQKVSPKILVSAIDEIYSALSMLNRNVSLKSVALRLPLRINR